MFDSPAIALCPDTFRFPATALFPTTAIFLFIVALTHLGQEQLTHTMVVRLDIFNGLQRISISVKQSHGAFGPFMARLRDACFIVNREDIEEASFC